MQENKQTKTTHVYGECSQETAPEKPLLSLSNSRYPHACVVTHRKLGVPELGGAAELPPC